MDGQEQRRHVEIGSLEYPEIVFGMISPIGTDLDLLNQKLRESLSSVGYTTYLVHLVQHIPGYGHRMADAKTKYEIMRRKIHLGTEFRSEKGRSDIMAGIAVNEIQNLRYVYNSSLTDDKERRSVPLARTAYVLRQLKTKKEVAQLRSVYGSGLYLISAYSSHQKRKEWLARNLGDGIATADAEKKAEELIHMDQEEEGKVEYGQRLRETFPEGDFFIDMDNSEDEIATSVKKLIEIIFGVTRAPTREEYGMFHAFGTALTSSSLSRQVGAAITTSDGDVIADGANEVPKPGGGLYWDDDVDKLREYELGYDINQRSKRRVFVEITKALYDKKLIIEEPTAEWWKKIDAKALLLDRLELSRTVHAEMGALMTAARLGVSVKGCTLYTTTFPCHNCAKHILAAGIKEIVYIEPYPKGLTPELYPDSITKDKEDGRKLPSRPFIGVAPRRYIELFQFDYPTSPVIRKDEDGNARKPSDKDWKSVPRFFVDPIAASIKESLLISSFANEINGGGEHGKV